MSSNSLLVVTSFFPSKNTQQAFKTQTNQTQGFRVSCNATPNEKKLILPNVDRRNLLVGLGGLYTAANLPEAIAAPITAPDITKECKDATSGIKNLPCAVRTTHCCPPSLEKTIKLFEFPKQGPVRMRWPAHNGTKEQVDKYRRAIQAMRDLDPNHPHSFTSQAKIHCAYCNGGYTQIASGFDHIDLQVHNSWLFFPFHRWYLYFYERILGNLINDPTFALPYWNWDEPAGMQLPEIFASNIIDGNPNSLYDMYRDINHLPPALVDLANDGTDKKISHEQQIACNLATVNRDLIRNGRDTLSFFGCKYVAGNQPPDAAKSAGSVDAGCHTAVHIWLGDKTQPNKEDMGNFYSAGYDPAFYIHHVNVDRMWIKWRGSVSHYPGHVDPTDPDWLNASYVFYDENQDLVRVYNKDCVDINKLNYNFIESEPKEGFDWRKARPAKRSTKDQVASTGELVPKVDELKFPLSLENIVKVRVKRPVVNRSKEEKEQANEILLINGIKYDCDKFVKFDVFVNDKVKEGVTPPKECGPEYAGGFAQIPHNDNKKMFMPGAARFGLIELLEDTNTEGEEYATVTLVPRVGCEDLTIGKITIELIPLR